MTNDMKKYDAILYVEEEPIIKEMDERIYSRTATASTVKSLNKNAEWLDPKLFSPYAFGQSLSSALSNLGNGYSCKVTDFSKWIVVDVSHHDILTGRTSSKTFLIIFKNKTEGTVFSTHNRYRTISGVGQAASYIRSAMSTLQTSNQTKIG